MSKKYGVSPGKQEMQELSVETAKQVRETLKQHFPGQRFRVSHLAYNDSYRQSACVWLYWTGGPQEAEVEAVCQQHTTDERLSFDYSRREE